LRGAALLLLFTLSACDSSPATRGSPTTAPTHDAPPPVDSARAPLPASVTATAAAPAPGGALAGTWEGRYEAKKGSVGLPPKVKDKALEADDGRVAAGAGTVTLTVTADGELRGTGSGALGACTFTGKIEDGTLRATMSPEDPRAPGAMTGILVGALKGDAIQGEIKAAGRDGTLVREAAIELKKK
jgi:hypothetical protein